MGICEHFYFRPDAVLAGRANPYRTAEYLIASKAPFEVLPCAEQSLPDGQIRIERLGIIHAKGPFKTLALRRAVRKKNNF